MYGINRKKQKKKYYIFYHTNDKRKIQANSTYEKSISERSKPAKENTESWETGDIKRKFIDCKILETLT